MKQKTLNIYATKKALKIMEEFGVENITDILKSMIEEK